MILGIDTGGTFTDFVLFDGKTLRIHKVLSTPCAPEKAIMTGIGQMGLDQAIARGDISIIHGTTVATNATLENKGVNTAYITNRGFKDVLHIGRQTRPELYKLQPIYHELPLSHENCLEVRGRIDAKGNICEAINEEDLQSLVEELESLKPEAIAINLLFSFINPSQELKVKETLQDLLSWQPFIITSHEVLPQYKEYERGIATWLNARLAPLMMNYMERLKTALNPCPLAIMQSSGGSIDANQAGKHSVRLLLSGPAGGLVAANEMGHLTQSPKLVTFDMGGTSTDVALLNGKIPLTNETVINQLPISIPSVAMHTIGAGGGSIAYIDEGGLLQVGPQSAGAAPGPACYGKGGSDATVSDANALLGRLHTEYFLGGNMQLDISAAEQAIQSLAGPLGMSLEETALGILDIVNESMSRALRKISVGKGYDLNQFKLCSFGGAGGLHLCALADSLEIREAIAPVQAGVFSAFGLAKARKERQLTLTHRSRLDKLDNSQINSQLERLAREGILALENEGLSKNLLSIDYSLNLCYEGQAHTLSIPWQHSIGLTSETFRKTHLARYGHALSKPVELVDLCATVKGPKSTLLLEKIVDAKSSATVHSEKELITRHGKCQTSVYLREQLRANHRIEGPALICEQASTTWIEPGWMALVDTYGNLLLRKMK